MFHFVYSLTLRFFTFHFSLFPYTKYPEHLSRSHLVLPHSTLLYISLHLLGGSNAQRMRFVAKGVSELVGRLNISI